MKIQFSIFPKEVSLNTFYSGNHWSKRKAWADKFHKEVSNIIRYYGFPMFKEPVDISIYYNNKFDIDNQGAMSKMIIDGMKGLVIIDDNRKYVHSLHQLFHDKKGIVITVESIKEE